MESKQAEVCIISVMFHAPDDNFALNIKTKIKEMLSTIPEAKIDFALRSGVADVLHQSRVR